MATPGDDASVAESVRTLGKPRDAGEAISARAAAIAVARSAPPVEGLTAVTTDGERGARAAGSNTVTAEDLAPSPDVTAGASAGRLGDTVALSRAPSGAIAI